MDPTKEHVASRTRPHLVHTGTDATLHGASLADTYWVTHTDVMLWRERENTGNEDQKRGCREMLPRRRRRRRREVMLMQSCYKRAECFAICKTLLSLSSLTSGLHGHLVLYILFYLEAC